MADPNFLQYSMDKKDSKKRITSSSPGKAKQKLRRPKKIEQNMLFNSSQFAENSPRGTNTTELASMSSGFEILSESHQNTESQRYTNMYNQLHHKPSTTTTDFART